MTRPIIPIACTLAALVLAGAVGLGLSREPGSLVVFGGMHDTLAKGEHQARVRLADLNDREHFFGVGAIEGLKGEITILDSAVFATAVTPEDRPEPVDGSKAAATLLVGQSVPHWSVKAITQDVAPEDFDDIVRRAATGPGGEPSDPFMFVIEGELTDVRLHVINGACPIHARINKLEVPADKKPYELEVERILGTVVGVYAADAVGKLTHPATRTHAHLIFLDKETGAQVTGHLERVGIVAGATLKVPGYPTGDVTPEGPEGDR